MIQPYKQETVKNITERLEGAKSIVLVDYKGINIEEVDELRNRMRKESKDGNERFANIGINDQKLYLPKTPEVGNENEVPFEAETRHYDRMRMARISGKIGDIHSHPNKFWDCFMEDSDVQAFSTQDLSC